MKLFAYIGCLVLLAFLPACRTAHVEAAGSAPPEELLDRHYLFEIVRHLYRWQLDESEIERIISTKQLVFWVGRFEARLDPGDRSILGEILLPQLSLGVKVKKADYTIEELGTVVRSQTFRITHVTRGQTPDRAPGNYAVVQVDMKELR
ncbi:MAG TPA: hypothetical protein VGR78_04055, partial [Verrucomicrobiae bacterium]|nr:hypothetical protein [Verrucomicrobiae bacterium]